MPSLGADMESGTIIEWRVKPGDTVHRGDIVAVVDTEKSDIEVEVFEDGVIESLLVDVGREVPIGTPLARITSVAGAAAPAATEPAPEVAEAVATPALPVTPKQRTAPARPKPAPPVTTGRVPSSPWARRRAGALGIDLASLTGSGPGGAIVAADVEGARAAPHEPGKERVDRHAAMRHAIGELMARSKREIPHYYLATTIDVSVLMAWLADANSRRPITERLLPAAALLKATALAARRMPSFNGFWDGGLRSADAVHLGVAVSLRGGGLVAPAIHDADSLPLPDLMAALRDVVERARGGRLRSSEMSDPTLTVTNLGEQGADEVYGVIYPPQVALVGFGRVAERPWAFNGLLGVRPTLRATLAADHRATDGHEGSRFLVTIEHLLQNPEEL